MSSSAKTPAGIVFGAGFIGLDPENKAIKFATQETAAPVIEFLKKNSIDDIDTARVYPPGSPGKSEEYFGLINASSWAAIDTKIDIGGDGSLTAAKVTKSVEDSLAALKTDKVRTMYLHVPDRQTPFEETLRAIHEQYKLGRFEKFGISNYRADEVQRMIDICEKEGLVKPSVYQGQYNAIFRGGEKELFPLLRQHGIAFFAYSPMGAGVFSGKINKDSANVSGSRWDKNSPIGGTYRGMYFKDSTFEAATKVAEAAKKYDLDGNAVALRWVVNHSVLDGKFGDKVILGASTLQQLESNVANSRAGPLPKELVDLVDGVWSTVSADNSIYHL